VVRFGSKLGVAGGPPASDASLSVNTIATPIATAGAATLGEYACLRLGTPTSPEYIDVTCCPRHDEKRPSGVRGVPGGRTVAFDEGTRVLVGLRRFMDASASLAGPLSPW